MEIPAQFINTPLMIHPEKLTFLLEQGFISGDSQASIFQEPRPSTLRSGLAIIPVHDVLVYRARGFFSAFLNLTSYEEIRASFREAMNDPSVSAIAFDIDSPGGEAAGNLDLADEIYAARGKKPIYAIANENALSAAYAIASAADQVFLSRIGGVGSIGVVALHVDQSALDAQRGLKYTYIYAGDRKIDFTSHKALSQEAFASVQAEINDVYTIFVETVARNRGLGFDAVRGTQAAIFSGEKAVEAGLADRVLSWDQALNEIMKGTGGRRNGRAASSRALQKKGEKPMDREEVKTQLEALLTTPDVDTEGILAELGYVPIQGTLEVKPVDEEAIRTEATQAGREEVRSTVVGILDLCALAGMPEMAGKLIKEGASIEEARQKILSAKAAASGKDEIISTVGATSFGEINPLVADAKKRAGKK